MRITLLRSGNRLVVDPTTKRVRQLLSAALSYNETVHYHGREWTERRKRGLPPVDVVTWECFGFDFRQRLGTSFGFLQRVMTVLQEAGYEVDGRYATQEEFDQVREKLNTVYKPEWQRIEEFEKAGFSFRHRQREALELFAKYENGRIDCPPAWGKGTVIMLWCRLFPRARFAIISKRVDVLHQRLYPELQINLPSVGIRGGGKNITGCRVMCYTADSMHHARGDEDFVIFDEGHEACAKGCAYNLGLKFANSRFWGLSATWDMRLDNADMRAEAIFGPIRLHIPYAEAEEHGLVAPIEVLWSDVDSEYNPAADTPNPVEWKRRAYWTNSYRNECIARDARLYADDAQTLITVETLEHALYLQRELPEFELVYNGSSVKDADWRYYRKKGLLSSDFRQMTPERRQKMARRFTRGKLKKVIATSVWNVGVDFTRLQVLIRADGGASPINDTQIPGRTSRTNQEGKMVGIVHDYRDQFDEKAERRSQGRSREYAKNSWRQRSCRGQSMVQKVLRGE
jgi:superfamily II DNA or RNA helicase